MRWSIAMLAVVAWAGVAGAVVDPTAARRQIAEQLKAAIQKAQANDCTASLKLVAPALADPGFAAIDERWQSVAYGLAAYCAGRLKDVDAAYRYAVAGTQIAGAPPDLWGMRIGFEVQRERYEAAVTTLEGMNAADPTLINGLRMRFVYGLYRGVKALPDKAVYRRLLTILAAPGYKPNEVLATGDTFRKELAAILVDADDPAGARALIALIDTPEELVGASVDPRLRGLLPASFDERAAVERELARARQAAADHPELLAPVLAVSQQLRRLGRPQEALEALEAARPEGAKAATFTDLAERGNWWWDEMGRIYSSTNRYAEAVAAYQHGIAAREEGTPNVSQTINLGGLNLAYGHYAEAIAGVEMFEERQTLASPFGNMQAHAVLGCARAASGQTAAAQRDVAFAKAHEADAPSALMTLLLCVGDMDGAAAVAIRRLDNPDQRGDALLEFSDFDPPVVETPKSPSEKRWDELKARADVQQAIKRAGGTRRFHVQDVGW